MNRYVALKRPPSPPVEVAPLRPEWRLQEWHASCRHPHPPGVGGASSFGFFLILKLGLFASADYGALAVRHGGRLIHRTVVFPRDPRIGFMDSTDLQVGNIFTHPDYRQQGLARAVLAQIQNRFCDRQLWFFADEDNAVSIQLAETAGFQRAGLSAVSRFCGYAYRYGAPVLDAGVQHGSP